MESLNNESPKNTSKKKGAIVNDTKSAGRPKMKDNNDDNEFATTPLKATVADVASAHAGEANAVDPAAVSNGSADKIEAGTAVNVEPSSASSTGASSASASESSESSSGATASLIEQKLNAKMEELAQLVAKAGSQIQRLGEALVKIGDKVEHLPERRFNSRKEKPESHTTH